MIDIFLLSIIAAVGQLGMLASIHAEPGALFFSAVLLCNIFAYELYRPQWIWESPSPSAWNIHARKKIEKLTDRAECEELPTLIQMRV